MPVYGFKLHRNSGQSETVRRVVKANTTVTKGDPIHLEVNTADLAAAGEPIFGIAQETVVQTSGSLTVEILVGKDLQWVVDNDQDTNTWPATTYAPGSCFDITGATGAVLVDTSTAGATGQLIAIDTTPDASDVSLGIFKINPAESFF
jgi:hypothetical protein